MNIGHERKTIQLVTVTRDHLGQIGNTEALYSAKATGGRSAFNVAVADYFNAPQIDL